MPSNRPPSDDCLRLAAELRAGGHTWDAVAARLRRSPETVRRWPAQYPDRWRDATQHAERRLAAYADGESVAILRQLLQSKDERMRWHAARALVLLRLELARLDLRTPAKTTRPDATDLFARLLGSPTEEQLAELIASEIDRQAELPGGPK